MPPLGASKHRAKGEEFVFHLFPVYHFSLANLYHFLLPSPPFMSFQAEMYIISRQVESFILLKSLFNDSLTKLKDC